MKTDSRKMENTSKTKEEKENWPKKTWLRKAMISQIINKKPTQQDNSSKLTAKFQMKNQLRFKLT